MLKLTDVEAMYGRVILALRGVTIEVPDGSVVALLGANGAGKSTTLKAISGLIRSENGEVTQGTIELDGRRIDRKDAAEVVRAGVTHVMEGRRIFPHLTVQENLIAGAHTARDHDLKPKFDLVYTYFPRLKERQGGRAGYLSGGEQQMLAIGRALMANPRVLLLDEPSLGLAPLFVQEIFAIIRRINTEAGTTILLVEQNARAAMQVATYAYVLENGRIALSGPTAQLSRDEGVQAFYLGVTAAGERRGYRELKHYRR
ncbi:MAG: ABC transporter ATP-binding protein, partial [Chloroflexi bacterium]|nr:ABC transporter ATP-binding protein [Chloroflexota bacterium]